VDNTDISEKCATNFGVIFASRLMLCYLGMISLHLRRGSTYLKISLVPTDYLTQCQNSECYDLTNTCHENLETCV